MSRIRPLASWRLALPILLLTPLAACRDELPTSPAGPQALAAVNPELTDRYIVVFHPNVPDVDAMVEALTRAHGGAPGYRYYTVLKGFAATLPAAAVEGIRRNPNVAYVEPDGIATKVGSQTLLSAQWGLDRIDERALSSLDDSYTWDTEGTGVEVYIVDTGIWFAHSEFGGRASSFWDYVGNDANAGDCDGHGTHVAGTVGGATVGVAKQVKLLSARVLGCSGSGSYTGIIKAIDDITTRKADPVYSHIPMVGNMSLGGPLYAPLNEAVNNSVAKGVVWAVAAGNSSADACWYSPSSADDALTVGATTSTDARSSFSNYGPCLDLFAPGSSIYSSVMRGGYESWSGTSMATPHVAGVAALYLSNNTDATAYVVNEALTVGATKDVVASVGTGSPNLLLYSLLTGAPSEPVVMHLGDLTGSKGGNKNWSATVTAAVHDPAHQAVSGALVTFGWILSTGTTGTGSCTTESNGTCSYTKSGLKNAVASIEFEVTGISKTGAAYDSGSNDVEWPTVTVSK